MQNGQQRSTKNPFACVTSHESETAPVTENNASNPEVEKIKLLRPLISLGTFGFGNFWRSVTQPSGPNDIKLPALYLEQFCPTRGSRKGESRGAIGQ